MEEEGRDDEKMEIIKFSETCHVRMVELQDRKAKVLTV